MQIGHFNTLKVTRFSPHGAYLSDRDHNEVLLPQKFLPQNIELEQELEVFIYTDSSDRPIATTQKPFATCDEISFLKIKDINHLGCFLDLGLDKDIFMPSKNPTRFHIGEKVCVFLTLDKQQRIIAKLGVKEHLKPFYPSKHHQPYLTIDAIPFEKTPLGIGCIVYNQYYGLLYHNELHTPIELFEKISVQIKTIRKDGKLDLKLDTTQSHQIILQKLLKEHFLDFHYDSDPQQIQKTFNMSKKTFKKSLTYLIKNKKIILKNDRIYPYLKNNKN